MKTTSGRDRSENPVQRSMPRPMSFGAPAATKKRARKPCTLQRTRLSRSAFIQLLLRLVRQSLRHEMAVTKRTRGLLPM
jgi:hypothetical protein